jgi:pilus assembly protein Flp/PilA
MDHGSCTARADRPKWTIKGAFTHMNLFVLRTWLQAKFDKEQRGASLVEYVLLVALIALIVIAAVAFLGNVLNSKFDESGSRLSNGG